jgi:hypothetical protein
MRVCQFRHYGNVASSGTNGRKTKVVNHQSYKPFPCCQFAALWLTLEKTTNAAVSRIYTTV